MLLLGRAEISLGTHRGAKGGREPVSCAAREGEALRREAIRGEHGQTLIIVVVAMVRTELPPAVTDAGLKEPVAPAPSPLADKVTVRAMPDATCVLTVYTVLEPWTTVCADGLAAIAKSSSTGAVTVRLTAVVCVAGCEL